MITDVDNLNSLLRRTSALYTIAFVLGAKKGQNPLEKALQEKNETPLPHTVPRIHQEDSYTLRSVIDQHFFNLRF